MALDRPGATGSRRGPTVPLDDERAAEELLRGI
ncbi:hypothetical protein SCALM49S_09658 [Streptomyces californicus]